jgi:RNA polymerase sigma factor (sigma-70 family)
VTFDGPAPRRSPGPDGRGSEGEPRLRVVGQDSYESWDHVYVDNVSRLYRLMYSKVGNRLDAEDLTAEVFMAALGPLQVDLSRGEVRAYLLATARTVLAGFWRRRLRLEVTSIEPDHEDAAPGLPGPPSQAPDRTATILQRLPDRYRRILELRFLEAMSIKEAASAMDVTVANAKVLQHRALKLAAASGGET